MPAPAHSASPRLSVVATSRNDGHGGDLLERMQWFIDGLAAQCERHRLPTELIVVEWNPPADRPGLRDVLRWPNGNGLMSCRIITVPPDLHRKFQHSAALPLFQMIAKNVGIRRARGDFILATNIDILFSDDIIRRIGAPLTDNRLYRCDRYDVPSGLPPTPDIAATLAHCRTHAFRINARRGTLLRVGSRWRPANAIDSLAHRALRRMVDVAFNAVRRVRRVPHLGARVVRGAGRLTRNAVGHVGAGVSRIVQVLSLYRLHGEPQSFTRTAAFVCRYVGRRVAGIPGVVPSRLRAFKGAARTAVRKAFGLGVGLAFRLRAKTVHFYWQVIRRDQQMHTNACGDFTLLSKGDWLKLRGYPEWPIFSWHLDSVLLHQARANGIVEIDWPTTASIYHIEHAHGSGYTPEGIDLLFSRLDKAGIPYLTWPEFRDLADGMRADSRDRRPVLFNDEDWGMLGVELPETVSGAAVQSFAGRT